MTRNEERINKLFEELVPPTGKCESKAGEIIRAISKINYRFFNDGDRIGVDYGNETCNAPARYLCENTYDEIEGLIADIWGEWNEDTYEIRLDRLNELVADYVENNPQLRNEETDDMLEYDDPDDYKYDEEDDEW